MTPTGALFALGTAAAFSAFDATRKQVSQHLEPIPLTAWVQLASLPGLFIWAAVTGWSWRHGWWLPGVGSIVLQAVANLLFMLALHMAPLSRTIPFLALTPVLSGLLGWMLLSETPSEMALLGMTLVTAGAFVLALVRSHEGLKVETGSLLMVVVAGLWSTSGVVDKSALAYASPATHALLTTFGGLIVLGTVAVAAHGRGALCLPRAARLGLVLSAVFGSAAQGLQLTAFAVAQVSAVETIKRAVGGAAALVLGRITFGEPITLQAVAAVAVMTAGTILVLSP